MADKSICIECRRNKITHLDAYFCEECANTFYKDEDIEIEMRKMYAELESFKRFASEVGTIVEYLFHYHADNPVVSDVINNLAKSIAIVEDATDERYLKL